MFFGKNEEELSLEKKLVGLEDKKKALQKRIEETSHAHAAREHWRKELKTRENYLIEISVDTKLQQEVIEEKTSEVESIEEKINQVNETYIAVHQEHSDLVDTVKELEAWMEKLTQQITELETDGVYKVLTERFNHVFPDKSHTPVFSSPSRTLQTELESIE